MGEVLPGLGVGSDTAQMRNEKRASSLQMWGVHFNANGVLRVGAVSVGVCESRLGTAGRRMQGAGLGAGRNLQG